MHLDELRQELTTECPCKYFLTELFQKPTKLDILKEEPLQDLKRILQELTSSDSQIPFVDLSSHGGRKSPLTTMRNAGQE